MVKLNRYPSIKNDPLQAWDSADELLLSHLKELDLTDKRLLILNDQFGALSCALQGTQVLTYVDSFVSSKGIELNSKGLIVPIHDLSALQGKFDLAVMKIPKNLSFFEDELAHLTSLLKPNGQVICASMVKHLASGAFDLIEKYIGKTTTSLAQKKARLVFATFKKTEVKSPYPIQVRMDPLQLSFTHHSNLFSREKLDIGTRFFLEHLPKVNAETVLDLGCANGIVGVMAKKLNPKARIIFSDDSFMAIQSAKENYAKLFSDEASFCWTNCFENQEKESIDLVLCNPPFHQNNTIGDHIAWQMFTDAHHVLKKGGLLRVIGNSHLNYGLSLRKIFGNSTKVAANQKFVIVDAVK